MGRNTSIGPGESPWQLRLDAAWHSPFSSLSGNGTELSFNNGQLFYEAPATKAEEVSLGNYLVREQYFDGQPGTVQTAKSGNTYEFRMVIKTSLVQDQEVIDYPKAFCRRLSENVFNNSPVGRERNDRDDHADV
jgi:hypothetical protein